MALSSLSFSVAELYEAGLIDTLASRDMLLRLACDRVETLAAQRGFGAVKQQLRGGQRAALLALVETGNEPFLEAFG